jgi:hypothetical protein
MTVALKNLLVLGAICHVIDELDRQAEMEAHGRRQIQAGLERAEKMRQEDAKRLAGKPTLMVNMFEMAKAKKRR